MGAENAGMTKVCRRETDEAFGAAIAARGAEHHATMTQADYTAAREAGYARIMAAGWADRYGDTHPMNAHHRWVNDSIAWVNAQGTHNRDYKGSRDRMFKGSAGWHRFTAPYWDARDEAWVDGATSDDADAAGYQAMCDHYGCPAPFWAWW